MDSVPAILTVIDDLQGEQTKGERNMGFGDSFKLNERGQPGNKTIICFFFIYPVCAVDTIKLSLSHCRVVKHRRGQWL
jgi:hypothetical protein